MVSQTRRRGILIGLIIAHVLLNGVALAAMLEHVSLGWGWLELVLALFMLGPSQATLLAFWAMLGGGKTLWRVLPTVLGMILYLWLFQRAGDEWRVFIFVQFCIWGPLLALARLMGLKIVRSSAPPSSPRPFQFSIWDMLAWTTALAVVFSLLRCLPTGWFSSRLPSLSEGSVIFGSFFPVMAATLYCSFGKRWLVARILTVPLAIAVGTYWLAAASPTIRPRWFFAISLGFMAGWLVGSFALVRLAGYRLTWQWRFSRSDVDAVLSDEAASSAQLAGRDMDIALVAPLSAGGRSAAIRRRQPSGRNGGLRPVSWSVAMDRGMGRPLADHHRCGGRVYRGSRRRTGRALRRKIPAQGIGDCGDAVSLHHFDSLGDPRRAMRTWR